MIVDCHTHINCLKRGAIIEEHRDACGDMDACFVLAAADADRAAMNQQVIEYVSGNAKAFGFAVINPATDAVTVKAIKQLTVDKGLSGLVLYNAEDNVHPCHSRAMRLYEAAQGLELVVYFHNNPPFSSQANMEYANSGLLDEIARTFPELKMVVGRMGLPFYNQTEVLLAKHPNVYADLSIQPHRTWQVYNLIVSAYEAGIMDKLLFGSGFPFAEPGICIETLLGFNKMFADTHLPQVPREKLRSIVERDTLTLLGLK
ncbi:MAG: amidohydrolase family protein [Planctomycetota bacterium]|jgi:predicted TIM-barrel fold metal-dependent hydrolase